MKQGILTLDDAVRLTGPLSFNLMVKPVGSLCNLGCTYCYYLDKAEIYSGHEPRMSLEQLHIYVKTFIESCEVPQVTFNWHGGEPLLAGLDFYKKAVEYQKQYAGGKKIINTIQTNGTLLTPEWAQFLHDEDFLVGVSIDGPEHIHDAMRRDRGGRPTFDKVLKGIEILYRAGVQYNLMTAVNHHSEGHALEIYQFLKSLGTPYIQLLPVAERIFQPHQTVNNKQQIAPPFGSTPQSGSTTPFNSTTSSPQENPNIIPCTSATDSPQPAPWNITAKGWGDFLCEIFDYWASHDVGRVFVNVFDATLAGWCGVRPGSCVFDRVCGGNAVMEHNGDIYPCDHFVYPGMKIGNLYQDKLKELMRGPAQSTFGIDKTNTLTQKCLQCRYLPICNGECPKHRFDTLPGENHTHNTLCEGYLQFFRHSENAMLRMRQMLQSKNE